MTEAARACLFTGPRLIASCAHSMFTEIGVNVSTNLFKVFGGSRDVLATEYRSNLLLCYDIVKSINRIH
jgi:hypothetical protein